MQNHWLQVLFLLFSLIPCAKAGIDPSITWEKMESPHFEVLFNAKYQELAREYLVQAERAFLLLEPVFKEAPEKTIILLTDETDVSNGSANGIPYPIIVAYPVLPTILDTTSHYGNWAQELLTHEYTHILNVEPAHSFYSPLRFIFGSIVRPNALLPRWYLEGLAVAMETQFTHWGRLRSPYYRSLLRAYTETKSSGSKSIEEENISRINETRIPTFPGGNRPYLMGSLLWKEMIDKKGIGVAYNLNRDYSERVPFLIDSPAREHFEKNYQQLLDETYRHTELTSTEEIQKISTSPVTAGSPFPRTSEVLGQHSPTLSPDGMKLAFVQISSGGKEEVLVITRPSSDRSFIDFKPEAIDSRKGINKISWSPDSKKVLYDGVEPYGRYNSFSDLFIYDFESKQARQITSGARAREGVFSPDGKFLFFVQTDAASNRLSYCKVDGTEIKTLYSAPLQHRISRPSFISDRELIFLERNLKAEEKLMRMDPQATAKPSLYGGISDNVTYLEKQFENLVYVSDRTGVHNLYIAAPDKKSEPRALTNVTSAVVNGAIDLLANQIYVSRLTSEGSRLEAIRFSKEDVRPPSLDLEKTSTDSTWTKFDEPVAFNSSQLPTSSYSSFSYLLPQYWIPFFSFVQGGYLFQATVYGADPLNKQGYLLNLGYDSLTNMPSANFLYQNNMTPTTISLMLADQYTYLYGPNLSAHTSLAGLTDAFFIAGLSNKWSGSAGWIYNQTSYPGLDLAVRQGPTVGISYNNVNQTAAQISPTTGQSFSANYTQFMPSLGNLAYNQLTFDGTTYFSKWLPKNHAVMLKTNVALSPDDHHILFAPAWAGGEYIASLVTNKYVVRGYPVGEFIGWQLATLNFEYRFPLGYFYQGPGTLPIFLRNMSFALVGDAVTLRGGYYNSTTKILTGTRLGRFFYGVGGELRFDTSLFYHLPATFRLGLYQGMNEEAYGQLSPYFGFLIQGLSF